MIWLAAAAAAGVAGACIWALARASSRMDHHVESAMRLANDDDLEAHDWRCACRAHRLPQPDVAWTTSLRGQEPYRHTVTRCQPVRESL